MIASMDSKFLTILDVLVQKHIILIKYTHPAKINNLQVSKHPIKHSNHNSYIYYLQTIFFSLTYV